MPLRSAIASNAALLVIFAALSVLVGVLVRHELMHYFERRAALSSRINKLLTRKNLFLNYQPLVDLRTGHVVGCEVLMRLRDGDAILPPFEVIKAVQEKHLTERLDGLVLSSALADLGQALPDDSFKIAVNLFPENIRAYWVSGILNFASCSGTRNKSIELEVIEQDYSDHTVAEVQKLRSRGLLVSVDDFGTGYSNLGNVRAIKPDFLKIDKSFVESLDEESLRGSMVPEIISIGRAVGAALIAEGIETPVELQQLVKLGVEYGQGYLLARPMPLADFAAFFGRHGPGRETLPNMQLTK